MKDSSFKKSWFPRNKKGLALILALFILVFIAILVVAFLELITSDLQITSNHMGRLQALYIADAGIEYVISQLEGNKYWTGSATIVFPAGSGSSYTYTYPKSGTTRVITSIGNANNQFSATVEARLSIQGSSSPYSIKIVSWQET